MVQFEILRNANYRVILKVENGAMSFWLNDNVVCETTDSGTTVNKKLDDGRHTYQWQVKGRKDITKYELRMYLDGNEIIGTRVGPCILKSSTDLSAGTIDI